MSTMSRPTFQYYLDKPDIEWCCPTCALPPLSDPFFVQDSEGEVLSSIMVDNLPECDQEKLHAAELSEDEEIISENAQFELLRRYHSKDLLIAHLNINSIQNKFEELSGNMKTIRAHIMFVSETKIDASYPNAQFTVPGYLFIVKIEKGGGGIMALISTSLIKTRLKLDKNLQHWKPLLSK